MNANPIRRTMDKAKKLLGVISSLMLVVIVLINGSNVFGRYVLSSPFSWGEEVMLFLMIGSIFIAIPAVTWDGTNIRMDIFIRALPERARRVLELLADLVSLAVAGLIVYAGIPIILLLFSFDEHSHAANVPMWLPQSAIPIGFALTMVALIAREISGKAAEHAASDSE